MIRFLRKDWAAGVLLALAALMVGSGLLALNGLEESHRGIETIYADRVVVLQQLKEIDGALGRELPLAARRAATGELAPAEAAVAIGNALSRSDDAWRAYLATYLVADELRLIEVLEPQIKKLELEAQALEQRLQAGEVTSAQDSARAFEMAFGPIGRALASLVEVQIHVTNLERELSGKRLRAMKVGAFIAIALGLLLAGVTAAQRARLREALRESQVTIRKDKALRKMLDAAAEAILFADESGKITYANEMAARTFGYGLPEFVGLSIEALVPTPYRSDHVRLREQLRHQPPWRPMDRNRELYGQRRDGTIFPAEVRVSMMDGGEEGQVAVAFVSDVSTQKQNEKRIANYKERLREMAFDMTLVEERQRRRIAADLHDNIGQGLALARIRLNNIEGIVDQAAKRDLAEAVKLVSEALNDARDLTFELSPPVLYDFGLPAALAWLSERFVAQHGFHLSVRAATPFARIDDETAGLLFRAVRELLTNAVKHAKTSTATVSLSSDDSGLTVSVEDQGAGFDASGLKNFEHTHGFGLFSVREQIQRLGGSFDVNSAPGQGTQITLRVPVTRPKTPQ